MSKDDFGKYMALIEPVEAEMGAEPDREAGYLVDAVPLRELRALAEGSAERRRVPVRTLALRTRIPLLADRQEPSWVQITVSEDQVGADRLVPAEHIISDSDGRLGQQFFVGVDDQAPSPAMLKGLRRASRLDWVQDAEVDQISEALRASSRHASAVAVYDVGQASMAALVNSAEHPVMFFDLGWPLAFNSKSRPTNALFDPLVTLDKNPAPVVLSHLDWDHWGYAIESGYARKDEDAGGWVTEPKYRLSALSRVWLTKRPEFSRHKLGPSHIHFMQTLANISASSSSGAGLLFWPKRRRMIRIGDIVIAKNRPRAGSPSTASFRRNNESLSILVRSGGAAALLCGDADYPSIPPSLKKKLTAMVAPHHGGRTSPDEMPFPIGHGRMVMSTYPGCYRSIPSQDVLDEAAEKGWRVAFTYDRSPCVRCNQAHGNRLVRLSQTPRCGCGAVPKAGLCIRRL